MIPIFNSMVITSALLYILNGFQNFILEHIPNSRGGQCETKKEDEQYFEAEKL